MTLLPFKPPPPGAEEHARAETERKNRLFAWVDATLEQLGVTQRIADATSFDELRKVIFDVNTVDVELAIRDALHPGSGRKADFLAGMKEGMLKRLLRKRFSELRREREEQLKSGRGTASGGRRSTYNWTSDLKLDKHSAVRPLLLNLICSCVTIRSGEVYLASMTSRRRWRFANGRHGVTKRPMRRGPINVNH